LYDVNLKQIITLITYKYEYYWQKHYW
jgi:hypothetical protein